MLSAGQSSEKGIVDVISGYILLYFDVVTSGIQHLLYNDGKTLFKTVNV